MAAEAAYRLVKASGAAPCDIRMHGTCRDGDLGRARRDGSRDAVTPSSSGRNGDLRCCGPRSCGLRRCGLRRSDFGRRLLQGRDPDLD